MARCRFIFQDGRQRAALLSPVRNDHNTGSLHQKRAKANENYHDIEELWCLWCTVCLQRLSPRFTATRVYSSASTHRHAYCCHQICSAWDPFTRTRIEPRLPAARVEGSYISPLSRVPIQEPRRIRLSPAGPSR